MTASVRYWMMTEVWVWSARLSVLVGGLAVGIAAVVVAGTAPEYSFSGNSLPYRVAELAAGWFLIAAGVLSRRGAPAGRFGLVLALGGIASFLPEFDNPGVGSPVVFAIGLVLHAICPPLMAHALGSYPARVPKGAERLVLTVGYVLALVPVGLLPAVVFDPGAQGCPLCPGNPLTIRSMPDVLTWSQNAGSLLIIGWAVAVLALLGRRLRSATVAARRRLLPVLLPGMVYVGLVGASFWHGLGPGLPSTDPTGRLLWFGQELALLALAGGLAVERVRLWRTRTAVARLVVDAAQARSAGLSEAIAGLLKDPSLALLFPLADGRTIDARGRPAGPKPGQVRTQLRHGGSVVAVLAHRPGLLDDPDLVGELTSLARLALYTERLQAETLVQLDDLRSSRARIVTIGDAERRRLERDLHDGVQQRLVTLALSIRLARMSAPAAADGLAEAEQQVRAALADLREVAHGLCPAILGTDGLAAGVEALAEHGPARLTVAGLPARRFHGSVELAAYVVIAETLKRSGCTTATVLASDDRERLLIAIDVGGADIGAATDLKDRVGAVGGSLTVDGSMLRAEFPCAL